jgi:hypothetical protein
MSQVKSGLRSLYFYILYKPEQFLSCTASLQMNVVSTFREVAHAPVLAGARGQRPHGEADAVLALWVV